MDKQILTTVRDYMPEDRNFILATWLRGLYYGDSWFKEIPKNLFMEAYHAFLERLLTKPGVFVRVVCLKDDPEVIFGYAVLADEGETVHWVFCKSNWRKQGLAKRLVPEKAKVVTHLTRVGLAILKKRPNLLFNPFKV